MYTGISTACFYNKMLNEDALLQIAAMGVNKTEIFFSTMMEYKNDYVLKLKGILDGEGLEMVSVHALPTQFEPQLFSSHPRQVEEATRLFREVLTAAYTLGAKIYVFHGPYHFQVACGLNLDMEAIGEVVTRLAGIAGEYGVTLSYENVHWCWYMKPSFASELLAHTDSDNLQFTLDVKQAAQSGCCASEYIDAARGRLNHVHVCDYRVDEQKHIMPSLPFSGEADWETLRTKLNAAGYDGCIMMEVYADNYRSFEQLKENYDRVDSFFANRKEPRG